MHFTKISWETHLSVINGYDNSSNKNYSPASNTTITDFTGKNKKVFSFSRRLGEVNNKRNTSDAATVDHTPKQLH